MKSFRIFFFLIALLILQSLIFSCTKEDVIEKVDLPPETAINNVSRYALVIEPYISFRDKPSEDGITSSHARSGEVLEVEAIKLEMKNEVQEIWVELKNAGWVLSSSLRLYPTKEKAITASKKLKQS